ncbi:MAG: antibiotic biosynthesis monooxygenase [Saprospiraceae bacterium]|nr:antibiotic biosynthesis monooxygenase [Saprospiraceae bacterium]
MKSGRVDDLKALATEMSSRTEEHEPGAVTYEYNLNSEGTECHIYERYADSSALMTHLGNFQEHFAGRFFDILEIKRWTVYGNPSEEVRNTLGGMGATFFNPIAGFSR